MWDRVIFQDITVADVLLSFIIMIIAALLGKALSINIKKRFTDKISKDRLNTMAKTVYYIIIIAGFLTVLPILDINLSGLMVAGGIMAIVIGFASQSIVSNLISGVFLTFEKPFGMEDVVKIGGQDGTLGTVEDIRIISTSIRTFEGVYVRIPNEKVFTSNITNFLENVARRFEYNVGIRYQDDADEAAELIMEVIEDHPLALKNPPPQVFVEDLGSSAVNLKVRVWGPSADWYQVKIELLWNIKKRLEENDIKIPFNQQEVWFMNELKKGK
ncbi:MAG: mechanosensitive ion channel family protein [Candidatus Saliniplasma sp.]